MRTGDVIDGRFLILQPVGSGGMGTVFKAVDRSTGQDVAVKVLRDADQSHAHRFEREAQLLAELRHPGIVRYVAHGRTPAPSRTWSWSGSRARTSRPASPGRG